MVDEGGVVKLGVRGVVEVVGVVVCAWFPEAGGVSAVEDKAAAVVGTVEGSLVLCTVVVAGVAGVVGSTLLAVVVGLTAGAEVRGSATGGGG